MRGGAGALRPGGPVDWARDRRRLWGRGGGPVPGGPARIETPASCAGSRNAPLARRRVLGGSLQGFEPAISDVQQAFCRNMNMTMPWSPRSSECDHGHITSACAIQDRGVRHRAIRATRRSAPAITSRFFMEPRSWKVSDCGRVARPAGGSGVRRGMFVFVASDVGRVAHLRSPPRRRTERTMPPRSVPPAARRWACIRCFMALPPRAGTALAALVPLATVTVATIARGPRAAAGQFAHDMWVTNGVVNEVAVAADVVHIGGVFNRLALPTGGYPRGNRRRRSRPMRRRRSLAPRSA